jgi:hypothetical protein
MHDQPSSERDFEWLDHVRPVGLVLARSLLKSLALTPEHQTRVDEEIVADLINNDERKPALNDPWSFFHRVLGWQARDVTGAPGGNPLDANLNRSIAEYETVL